MSASLWAWITSLRRVKTTANSFRCRPPALPLVLTPCSLAFRPCLRPETTARSAWPPPDLQLGGAHGGHGRPDTEFRGLLDWSAAHPTYGWASRSTRPVRRRRPGFWQLAGSTRRTSAEDSQPRYRPRHTAEPAVPANAGRPSMCCGCCASFPASALAGPSSPIRRTRPLRCGDCPRRAQESGDEGRIPDSCSRFGPGFQLNAPRRASRVTNAANSRPVQ